MVKIVNSLKRGLEVLEIFASRSEPMTISRISAMIDAPLSSTSEIIHTLYVKGFLTPGVDRKYYHPTPKLYHIGRQLLPEARIQEIDLCLNDLLNATGESALLLGLEQGVMRVVAVRGSSHRLRYIASVGHTSPLLGTAAGSAMLAVLPEEIRRDLVGRELHQISDETRQRQIDETLADIDNDDDQTGWHRVEHERGEAGVTSIAVPIVYDDAHYAIAISGPSPRIAQNEENICSQLRTVRQQFSASAANFSPARFRGYFP